MYIPCKQSCPYNTLRGCTILEHPGKYCPMGNMAKKENKPLTNADRIRSMTDEELSDFLEAVTNACFERSNPRCPNCPMKWSAFCDIDGWLKQPAKEGT